MIRILAQICEILSVEYLQFFSFIFRILTVVLFTAVEKTTLCYKTFCVIFFIEFGCIKLLINNDKIIPY